MDTYGRPICSALADDIRLPSFIDLRPSSTDSYQYLPFLLTSAWDLNPSEPIGRYSDRTAFLEKCGFDYNHRRSMLEKPFPQSESATCGMACLIRQTKTGMLYGVSLFLSVLSENADRVEKRDKSVKFCLNSKIIAVLGQYHGIL